MLREVNDTQPLETRLKFSVHLSRKRTKGWETIRLFRVQHKLIMVPKGNKIILQEYAKQSNLSLNAYINKLLAEKRKVPFNFFLPDDKQEGRLLLR